MDENRPGKPDDPPPVTSGEWARSLLLVLLVTLAVVGGGIWIIANTFGGCGTAAPCG